MLRYILSNGCQRDYELRLGVLFLGERGKRRTEGMTLGRERPHVSSELMTEQIFPLLTKIFWETCVLQAREAQSRLLYLLLLTKMPSVLGVSISHVDLVTLKIVLM